MRDWGGYGCALHVRGGYTFVGGYRIVVTTHSLRPESHDNRCTFGNCTSDLSKTQKCNIGYKLKLNWCITVFDLYIVKSQSE